MSHCIGPIQFTFITRKKNYLFYSEHLCSRKGFDYATQKYDTFFQTLVQLKARNIAGEEGTLPPLFCLKTAHTLSGEDITILLYKEENTC